MAQRTYLDLVNVEFSDISQNESTPRESDILGVVMPYPWGPVDTPHQFDKAGFFAQYPEALPANMGPRSTYKETVDGESKSVYDTANTHYFDAYLQVKQFFNNGGRAVEIICPQENKKYVGSTTVDGTSFGGSEAKYFIGLVYPGVPTTGNVGMKYEALAIRCTTPSADSNRCLVEVVAYASTSDSNLADNSKGTVIESFQGQWYDETKQISGVNTHFVKVLKNSQYVRCYNMDDEEFRQLAGKSNENIFMGTVTTGTKDTTVSCIEVINKKHPITTTTEEATTTTYVEFGPVAGMLKQDPTAVGAGESPQDDAYIKAYTRYFANIDKTDATILVGPVAAQMREENGMYNSDEADTGEESNATKAITIYNKILANTVSEYCMTRMSFIPFNGTKSVQSYETVKTKICDGLQDLVGETFDTLPKFTNLIDGCEQVTFLGVAFVLDCCGGVAGAYTTIARQVRVNQVASARRYGAYSGTLLKDPEFDDVLDNHDSGIVTIYNGANGPEIFGVHCAAYLEDTNSYYATNNVSRTLTWLLRDIFPLVLDAVHTDAAANPTTRSILNDACEDVVSQYITQGNLLEDSYFSLPASENSEPHNKKGRLLTCVLSCHFIGLVESIDFKIVATDSSISVETA